MESLMEDKKMLHTDMMIDLETLATSSDAVMLSIGAVLFNIEEMDHGYPHKDFYIKPNIDSQLKIGSIIQEGTLKWWLQQSDEARGEFVSPKDTVPIDKALFELTNFYNSAKPKRVWSHGAGFDLSILALTYSKLGMRTPWFFTTERDTRTLFELYAADLDHLLKPEGQTVHNAVVDARNQANAVAFAWRFLTNARIAY
jgi:exodeoxyribonuclease VIII